MVFNVMPAMMALSFLLSKGRNVADFTNDVLNNLVAVSSDSHQARMAQDVFRQEVRYARSLQIREDIRDQRKVMLESVTSYLFFGSMILSASFVTIIEGFPPLNTNRMVLLWWLLFGAWAVTFQLLAMWYALCFQVKLSQSARERLLRRYRYRLADDNMVNRLGGKSLATGYHMLFIGVKQLFSPVEADDPLPTESLPEGVLTVKVTNLNASMPLDVTVVRKRMNAWTHVSGKGYAKPTIVDVPYYLLNETLIRSTWHFTGESPMVFRVRGETTMYIAAQCPPIGGAVKENAVPVIGYQKALLDQTIHDWPAEELPIVTAGYHPAWRGISGHGEFQRVDGASISIDAESLEVPVYKIVLASPRDGVDGYVDVVVCWQFVEHCEGMCIILRKGAVHCQEDDWPMAEFNAEICQITPLQDYSGLFMKRGTVCLVANIWLAVLSRLWLLGNRLDWWLESLLLLFIVSPGLAIMSSIPISTFALDLTPTTINRSQQGLEDVDYSGSNDIAELEKNDRVAEDQRLEAEARMAVSAPSAPMPGTRNRVSFVEPEIGSLTGDRQDDSPPRVPRRSGGRVGGDVEDEAEFGSGLLPVLGPPDALTYAFSGNRSATPPLGDPWLTPGLTNCCRVERPPAASHETLSTEPSDSSVAAVASNAIAVCTEPVLAGVESVCAPAPKKQPRRSVSFVNVGDPSLHMRTIDDLEWAVGFSASNSASSKRQSAFVPVDSLPNLQAEELRNLPAATPMESQRCLPWLFCRRLRDHIGSDAFGSFSSSTQTEDTPILRMLRNITRMLDCVFFISMIMVMSSPAIDWFRASVHLGPTPGVHDDRRRLQSTAFWEELPVTWPPFMQPTAAALDESNGLLHVASGSVLWTLGMATNAAVWRVLGTPVVLPETVHGLGISGHALLAVGDTAAYELGPAQLGRNSRTVHSQQGLLDLARSATLTAGVPTPMWMHKLGPVESAVFVDVPRSSASSQAAVVASQDGDVHFCAATPNAGGGQVKVLAQLESEGRPLRHISGLHVSQMSETVLWAANHSGIILGLSLSTGRVLGTFDALPGTESSKYQRLRGNALLKNSSQILALTGNSTHLFVLAKVEQQRLALLCVPYPALGESNRTGAEL